MKNSHSIGPEGLDLPPLMEAATTYWIDTMQRWALFAGYAPAARKYVAGTSILGSAARPQLQCRARRRRQDAGAAGELSAGADQVPPAGVVIDRRKRPFIVFDPRAGHGPGIGGMKQDSEIGVALKAGHPCYFVGFLPEPMPGQTIEDVCKAEARFIEAVIEAEPEAEGRPCLIGNCQAGWQIMMTAALRPDLAGPDHPRRLAAVLLAGPARREPHALSRRHARRHLADRRSPAISATASSTAPT